jgi:putative ABC transport system permease protein
VAFAALATIIAAIGIYGVLSYSVRRRRREIGVRMALGAEVDDVVGLVVREGLTPTLIGGFCGLAGALALQRLVSRMVYGISPTDPATFGAVAVLLLGVALAASIIPAYRATRVEPTTVLREE